MKKTIILAGAVVLFGMAGAGHAVETEYGELGMNVDATWVSKYIFRGIDKLDDKAAFQPSVNLDFFDSGLSFTLWSSFAGSSGTSKTSTVNAEEWRYILTYANSVLGGEQCQTDYALSWVYYDYPDMASWDADTQEFNLALSWPNICPAGVVPTYMIVDSWPSKGGHLNRDEAGFLHVFGLDYCMSVEGFLPDNPQQVIDLSWNIIYNDGTYGSERDHDWSHMLWGISTDIALPYGTLTPAVYYQNSMEDTVNGEDEFWCGISYGFSF